MATLGFLLATEYSVLPYGETPKQKLVLLMIHKFRKLLRGLETVGLQNPTVYENDAFCLFKL